jgi:CheY-like chemotaxis protein/two-component sensor histidine kinase
VALQSAREGIERIATVTKDLRIFSRADDEAMERVPLAEVVQSARRLAEPALSEGVELELKLCAVPTVMGNRGRLGQVVTNLLVNAVQAVQERPPGARHVRVHTFRNDEGAAVLTVEDSGPGVPEAIRGRVFEPFFTTKPIEQGTGLGLALVAEIVRHHGGTISVGTSEWGGALFEILLPSVEHRPEAPASETTKPAQSEASRRKVLLIDDEVRLLQAYALQLEDSCDLRVASGGAEAIACIEKEREFDLILCDLQMPGIDGQSVFEHIRTARPELLKNFVFCTGGIYSPQALEFVAKSGAVVLEKPIGPDVLLALAKEPGILTSR